MLRINKNLKKVNYDNLIINEIIKNTDWSYASVMSAKTLGKKTFSERIYNWYRNNIDGSFDTTLGNNKQVSKDIEDYCKIFNNFNKTYNFVISEREMDADECGLLKTIKYIEKTDPSIINVRYDKNGYFVKTLNSKRIPMIMFQIMGYGNERYLRIIFGLDAKGFN